MVSADFASKVDRNQLTSKLNQCVTAFCHNMCMSCVSSLQYNMATDWPNAEQLGLRINVALGRVSITTLLNYTSRLRAIYNELTFNCYM